MKQFLKKHIAMKLFVTLLGILLIILGLSLILKLEFIFSWIDKNMASQALYFAAILGRLILGVLFIFAASKSKFPKVIKTFGYLFVLAAVILMAIGHESFKDFIDAMIPAFMPYAPVSGLLSIAFGGFLIYAFSWRREMQ